MIFLLGLDDDFAMTGGVAAASVDRFLSQDDRIVILHLGISGENVASLRECVTNASVDVIDCAGMLDDSWVPPGHVTSATYLRFLAADLLPDESTCLYLDGDAIVRRDPSAVFQTDMSNTTLAAVQSRVAPYLASVGGVGHWFELGLPSTHPYFNAGVLLMNLDRWRELDVTDRLTDYLRRYGSEILHGDQEAMNAVLCEDWIVLDRTWNYITHVSESFLQHPEAEPADPHVVHFAGRRKPWSHTGKPIFAEEWYQILDRTPWAGWRPAAPVPATGPKAQVRRLARNAVRRVRSSIGDP